MRIIAMAAIVALGACSDGAEEPANTAVAAAEGLQPGQWEMVLDVAGVQEVDGSVPILKLAPGDKVTTSSCVAQGEGERPDAALLAGVEDATCTYQNIYMSRGRLNAALSCRIGDLPGDVLFTVEGQYEGGTLSANSSARTMFPTAGDSVVTGKLTGRRTGDCAPAPAGS